MKGLTLRVSPPALTFLCLLGLVLFWWIIPDLTFKFFGQIFVSIILVVFGIAIVLIAIRRFYEVDTTVLPDEMDSSSALVIGGIFMTEGITLEYFRHNVEPIPRIAN